MRLPTIIPVLLAALTLANAALVVPQNITVAGLTSNWTYSGCYTDNVAGVASLKAASINSTGMTIESCVSFCYTKGYTFAGTENSQQCYCDNSVNNATTLTGDGECQSPCKGNMTTACGGPNRLSLYWSGKTTSQGPFTNSGPGNFSYAGCYNDSTLRTLRFTAQVSGGPANLTVAQCTTACQAAGYSIAGTEHAQDCWCDNSIQNYAVPQISGCTSLCNGNSSEFCGGVDKLNVYIFNSTKAALSASSTTSRGTSSSLQPSSRSTTTAPVATTSKATTTSIVPTSSTTSVSLVVTSSSKATTSAVSTSASKTTSTPVVPTTTKSSTSTTVIATSSSSTTTTVVNSTKTATTSSIAAPSSSSATTSAISSKTTTSAAVVTPSSSSSTTTTVIVTTSTTTTTSPVQTIPSTTSNVVTLTSSSVTTSAIRTTASSTLTTSASSTLITSAVTQSPNTTATSLNSTFSPTSTLSVNGTGTITTSAGLTSTKSTTSTLPTVNSTSTLPSNTTTSVQATTTSAKPATTTPACPGATGAIMIDQNGANYTIYCGQDTSVGAYGNVGVSTNWTACADACDRYSGCVAFVYSGGANGQGNGNCYFKNQAGTPVAANNNALVAGILNKPATSLPGGSSPTTTAAPVPTALPTGWKYSGCYIDNKYGRILQNQQAGGPSNTVESCVGSCVTAGYTVAGMEYSNQCFCGNATIMGATLVADSQCNMACSGNSGEMCGAGDRMSIYYTGGNLTMYNVPKPQRTSGNWTYTGCLNDVAGAVNRPLPHKIILMNNNTADNCLGQCAKYGYPYGGVEYGNECYCGDLPDIQLSGAQFRPEAECSMPCSGDPNQICGAGNRISFYNYTGPAPYVFNYPTGNAAGAYRFLIGGVTIPLITTLGINGKVTFLEKTGTGAPNQTGAYELDFAQLNNFTGAWRPMHTKTDVFCAAGVTLPDKAGRQLNIGGWSLESTFGVRLYLPDGSPGVDGKNNWEENVNVLSLQQGRWYPSAMIMTNGTVLVVGGESGSNAGPVPTLEILPTQGPVVYADWLNRTDPNNLYPFLAVLPGGGIFVAYYNEARILDPRTLDTIKSLPNSPASVESDTGGRTYPLEGSAVLLPQYAPYTDPLAIMMCGGSTPLGQGPVLDNCVTIQPEAPNPTWTLERMPSKRVLSNIVALPDGTYLILNGAQFGVAGFGLAKQPNLNAVLYDPTKPVGNRMSVMANTTVARMYHSEAILLQDGRVLVSGSDPEDPDFPQEYRVEVFIPPYLMSNPLRPSLTSLSSRDWTYGQSVSFTTNATTTTAPRVSLLGAESSTHGNNMGQRTLFPAVSCAKGGACTLTAPPGANIAPPGWYQMFVLDGPTPSISVFVRIGGDPAGLGNWPPGNDFTRPGMGPAF